MKTDHLSATTFASLDLPEPLLQGLQALDFSHCTPIQEQTLPLALQGLDVAGQAQTGTGKSAAFLLATFSHLLSHPVAGNRRANQPRALILAPTRELAIQIHKDATELGHFTDFKLVLAYGGTGYEKQRQEIKEGCDILIGTPGRLIDYFKQHVFDLRQTQVAILDEADRMFDLGFIADVRYLFRRMPKPEQRLSMLFSATLSHRVLELAYEHMNNPQSVVIDAEHKTADRVNEMIYHPASEEKIPLLIGLLQQLKPQRSMVFVNTKRIADRVWASLQGNDFEAAVLSGDVPQRKRQKLLERFQSGELAVLIATDVAARGIHVEGVTHVFNFDLPQQAEDYVHRIGRTARAGESGDAVSFACEEYAYSLPEIEAYIGHRIEMGAISDELLPELLPPAKIERHRKPDDRRGGRGGKPRNDRPHGERNSRRPRHAEPTAAEAQTPKATSAEGEAPEKKKRRRRRRHSHTAADANNQQPPAKQADSGSGDT